MPKIRKKFTYERLLLEKIILGSLSLAMKGSAKEQMKEGRGQEGERGRERRGWKRRGILTLSALANLRALLMSWLKKYRVNSIRLQSSSLDVNSLKSGRTLCIQSMLN